MITKAFDDCEKGMRALKSNRGFIKGKKYDACIVEIPESVIIPVVLSEVVSHILRCDDIKSQNVTALSLDIGKKIITGYYYYLYIEYKEGLKLNMNNNKGGEEMEEVKVYSFAEYKVLVKPRVDEALNTAVLSEEEIIKFGLFLIEYLSEKNEIYGVKVNFDVKTGKDFRYLLLKTQGDGMDIINHLARDNLIFPMISKPRDWKVNLNPENNEFKISESGGYLHNELEKVSFFHKSPRNVGVNRLLTDGVVETINYLQSVKFKINGDVLNVITDCLQDGTLARITPIKPHDLTNSIKELRDKKDFLLLEKIVKFNSIVYNNVNIITNALILRGVSDIYFPVFADWRGRYYSRTSSFSYQGSDLAKSLFNFKEGLFLNASGVKRLKIYIAKCYGLTASKSNASLLKWVDENVKDIININNKF